MDPRRHDRALRNPSYDAWKLAVPDYWDDPPQFRCDECGEWAEECECEDGPTEPEPYTRADYEADQADDEISEGRGA
ncbi:MAG: hypothetical protein HQ581_01190 [Planctomycetes bacterium]|nr:hypothetical protein [Planctomycetota bacterium]